MEVEIKCQDFGRPGCLGDPDENYTMRFDDIGEDPIHWCSFCGPQAQELGKLFLNALIEAEPEKREEINNLLTMAEFENESRKS